MPRILHIEDDAANRLLVRKLLTAAGHEVTDAADGLEGVRLALSTKPELVLVKPNVAVMTKNHLNLLNPNGWYCLKGQVSVLGKSEIHLHCKAKLASNRDGVSVLGATDHDSGVTVLGKSELKRVGCPEKEGEKTAAESTAAAPSPEKTAKATATE